MAGPQDVALEEVFWRSPQHLQVMGGYLHSNNILFYFAESPFFDATSNNASLAVQASYNDAFRHFVETREAFESRLQTMQGLEFMVAYDPLQAAAQSEAAFSQEPSNIWVVRKQTRRKRPGMDDEVIVLGIYYVVGDCIYMAPSVASVVGNRVLSVVASVTKLLNTASPLPIFSPSYGHTYMPPIPKALDSLSQPSSQSQQSKEATPMPDIQAQAKASLAGTSTNFSSNEDTRNLTEALALLSKYGDEFMDETPLVGEPGSFIFSKASDAPSSTRQVSRTNAPVPGSSGPAKAETASSVGRLTKTAEKEKLLSDSTDSQDLLKRKRSRAEI